MEGTVLCKLLTSVEVESMTRDKLTHDKDFHIKECEVIMFISTAGVPAVVPDVKACLDTAHERHRLGPAWLRVLPASPCLLPRDWSQGPGPSLWYAIVSWGGAVSHTHSSNCGHRSPFASFSHL